MSPTHSLIAYHANCIDGFTSAWIVARALDAVGETYELLAMNYTEKSEHETAGCYGD